MADPSPTATTWPNEEAVFAKVESVERQMFDKLLEMYLHRARWEDCSDPEDPTRIEHAHLLTHFSALGSEWTVEAIAVHVGEHRLQEPIDADATSSFEAISLAAAADGHFQTLQLPGRPFDYVVAVYPGMA